MKSLIIVLSLIITLGIPYVSFASGELFLNKEIADNSGYSLTWKHILSDNLYIKGDLGFEDINTITSKELEVGGKVSLNAQIDLVGSLELDDFGTGEEFAGTAGIDVKLTNSVYMRNQFKHRDKVNVDPDNAVYIGVGLKY